MENIEPYVLSSEREIVEFLNDLKASGRLRNASDYWLIVGTELRDFFSQKVKELTSAA